MSMIKNKAGREFLGDGKVLDLVYNLLWKTIKDCKIKNKYIHNVDYVDTPDGVLLGENDGRLQFAKQVLQLLEDEEEVLSDYEE